MGHPPIPCVAEVKCRGGLRRGLMDRGGGSGDRRLFPGLRPSVDSGTGGPQERRKLQGDGARGGPGRACAVLRLWFPGGELTCSRLPGPAWPGCGRSGAARPVAGIVPACSSGSCRVTGAAAGVLAFVYYLPFFLSFVRGKKELIPLRGT